MQSTLFEISSGKLLVRKEFLFNLESGHNEFLSCKIFAVSSYAGHVPTYSCVIEDKFLFHYLPINAFAWKETAPLSLNEANYFNCPSDIIEVLQYQSLKRYCQVFNKDGSFLDYGYVDGTIEWPLDNELCHAIKLESGNIVLRPSHKVILTSIKDRTILKLPSYKKLRSEWILKQ